ncbi:MAG: NUMOD4 domain-containing protein [Chitinophagaceae bacterium]|nr:NUMOD4 domain-containing protein [Chitinophagaceae bacterium]
MIRKLPGETWKPLQFSGWRELRKKYAVSTLGRIGSYSDDIIEDGKLLNGSLTTGYKSLNLHRPNSKGTIYIHREAAKLFCKKPSPRHKFVIHINHNKLDNRAANLKWATAEEVSAHQQKSPAKIAYKKIQASRTVGLKLNAVQVKSIKKIISDPGRKTTYRQLAKKYGISEMTLYRIKSGENWGRIK